MNMILFSFMFVITFTSYATDESAIFETIKEQKKVETELHLNKRRKVEMLKRQAQFMHRNELRMAAKGKFIKKAERPKNKVSENILKKIRKSH